MKMIIEVSGGMVCNITATQECSIYLVDHDNLKRSINGEDVKPNKFGSALADTKEAMQPDNITWEENDETWLFDKYLNEALEDYK